MSASRLRRSCDVITSPKCINQIDIIFHFVLQRAKKFTLLYTKKLQLLGDEVPQAPYRGFAPGPHWGTSVPQTPWFHATLTWNSEYAPALSKIAFFPLGLPEVGRTLAFEYRRYGPPTLAIAGLLAKGSTDNGVVGDGRHWKIAACNHITVGWLTSCQVARQ